MTDGDTGGNECQHPACRFPVAPHLHAALAGAAPTVRRWHIGNGVSGPIIRDMIPKLQYETFCLGEFMTNCFVVWCDGGSDCWLIDVGYEPEAMLAFVKERGLTPRQLILTHAHCDHIAGVTEALAAWPSLPVFVHEAERDWLTDPMLNLSGLFGQPVTTPPAAGFLEVAAPLELDGLRFELRHAPGHSPGSVVFYQPEAQTVFAGDTLFDGSIGRTDFPGGDHALLLDSIRSQLYTLPDETTVLPGHGATTTVGQEKQTNPFVR